ncbi:MAG: YbhB/YbcL family Raf kinase inhibitor-like protein [Lactobacillaceae bacterium]|jgi:Raf kinase inhibitor-like YbhB/YbcL family protein|nr:YbhB/YbcL family Raf kinase inhibitor-like protein [Lactobacillaceae bacterium]
MKITVPRDENGLLPDQFGKFAQGGPENAVSFPIEVKGIPAGTQSLAITLIDYDAVPVSGFPWIHWLAANLPLGNIPENLDHSNVVYSKGTNSLYSVYKSDNPELTRKYVGPRPPDKIHYYELTVFAVDTKLDLQDGFFLNEFRNQINNHILDAATVNLPYRSE